MPQPKGSRFLARRLHPAHAQKAMQSRMMSSDRLFRNGPLVVKSLVSTSPIYGAPRERAVDCAVASAAPAIQFRRLRRRSLASVRGRRDGRHMMPSEETASLSNHAWSVS